MLSPGSEVFFKGVRERIVVVSSQGAALGEVTIDDAPSVEAAIAGGYEAEATPDGSGALDVCVSYAVRAKAETEAEAEAEASASKNASKKKNAAIVVIACYVVIIAIAIFAFIASPEVSQTETTQIESTQAESTQNVYAGATIRYTVPESWAVEDLDTNDDDFGGFYKGIYADDFDGGILVRSKMAAYPSFTEDNLPLLLAGFGIEDAIDEYAYDGALVYLYEGDLWSGDKKGYVRVAVSGDYGSITVAWCDADDFDDHSAELKGILYSLHIVNPEAPSFSQTEEEEE